MTAASRESAEYKVTVHDGETFPIGDATWKVQSIEGVGTYDYTVRIVPVETA